MIFGEKEKEKGTLSFIDLKTEEYLKKNNALTRLVLLISKVNYLLLLTKN